MTVKTKLKMNMLFVFSAVTIVALAGTFGMIFVKNKISYLTEKSTPYQTKAMELQRAIQASTADLVKLSFSGNMNEYSKYLADAKKTLDEVKKAEESLEELSAKNDGVFNELNGVADDMFGIVKNKIKAKEEADASYKIIIEKMKNVSLQLKSVDSKIRTLQNTRSTSLMNSLENTQKLSSKLREVESIKNTLKDIQMLVLDIKTAKGKKTLLIAKGKLNSLLPKMVDSKYIKSNAGFSADISSLGSSISECIKLQSSILETQNQDTQNKFDTQISSVNEQISSLALKIEQDVVNANSSFSNESEAQNINSNQSNIATNSMADNAELVSLGLTIEGLTMKLFTTQNKSEIDAIEQSIRLLFSKVANATNRLEKSLLRLNAKNELQTLRGANGALAMVHSILVTNDSVISKLKNYISMQEEAYSVSKKLKDIVVSQSEKTKLSVVSAKDEQENAISTVNQIVKYSIISILIIGIGAIVTSLIFGLTIARLITKSIVSIQSGLTDFFRYLSKESNDAKLIDLKTKDEFGEMAQQINANIQKIEAGLGFDDIAIKDTIEVVNNVQKGFVHNNRIKSTANNPQLVELTKLFNDLLNEIEKTLNEINDSLIAYGNNDFAYEINYKKDGDFGITIGKVKELGELLSQLMSNGMKNGISLSDSSHALKQRVNVISDAANNQAASLEQTAAALEQLTSNVANNAAKAAQMQVLAEDAKRATQNGRLLADNTAHAINEISNATTTINEAISIIEQIAFQTNILSLNAAVEAATAGEAGKGFSVVAGEVRNLASRSAEAAKEIKTLAEQAKHKSEEGLAISNEMIKGFRVLDEKIQKTTELVEDVAVANKEQMGGITQINDAVSQLDSMTQENAKVAAESDDVANELLNMANIILDDAKEKNFLGKEKFAESYQSTNRW